MSEQWTADSTTYKIDYWWETQVLGKGGVVAVARSIKEKQSTEYANLIAAAPDLHYALKCILDELPSKRDWLDPVTEAMAKQAIAKAEGRQ